MSAGFDYIILNLRRIQEPQVPVQSNGCGTRANQSNLNAAISIIADGLRSLNETAEISGIEYVVHPKEGDAEASEKLSQRIKIYEESQSTDWTPRYEMIKRAFQDRTPQESIFSLSIIPKDPTVQQTVYIKKGRIPRPSYFCTPVSNQSQIKADIVNWRDESDQPYTNEYQGYIKPYDTYSNRKYKPNIDPAHIPSSYTTYTIEEAREIQGIASGVLREFEVDQHASAIGLIILSDLDKAVGKINRLYVFK